MGSNFSSAGPTPAGAVLKTLTLAGSTWNTLNFASGAAITEGAPATLPASGSITGFGLYAFNPSANVRFDNFQLTATSPAVPSVTTIIPAGTQFLGESYFADGIAWRKPTVAKLNDIDGDNIIGTAGYYLAKTTWGPGDYEDYSASHFDTSVMTFSAVSWLAVTVPDAAVNNQTNYGYRAFQNPNDTAAKISVGYMGRNFSTNTITGNYYSLYDFTVGSGLPGNFTITVATHPEIASRNPSALRLTQIAGSASGSATISITSSDYTEFNAAFTTFRIIGAQTGDVFQLLGQAQITSPSGSVLINGLMFDSVAPAPTTPAAPSALAVSAVASASQLTLTWTDNSANESGFKLERSANGLIGWVLITTTAANATSTTDTGLFAGTSYFYRLSATGGSGDSAVTSTASATPWSNTHAWLSTNGLPLNTDLTADSDNDGLSNLAEYALGGIPTNGSSVPTPTVGTSSNFLTLTFSRARADVTYVIQGSSNLTGAWTDLATNPGTVGQSVVFTDSTPLSGSRFLRLKMTQP